MARRWRTDAFKPEHVDQMTLREGQSDFRRQPEYMSLLARAATFPAWTGFSDDAPAACGGIVTHWQGVGEAWLFTSDLIMRHKIAFCCAARFFLDAMQQDGGFHRISACVNVDHPHDSMMKFLGFQFEGLMEQYGPDRANYALYARLRHNPPSSPLKLKGDRRGAASDRRAG
jgi:hypothetical protein